VDARWAARIPIVFNITAKLRLLGAKLQGEADDLALSYGGAKAPGAAASLLSSRILLDVMMLGMHSHGTGCRSKGC
jgi:hypothetical protein